MAQTESRQRKWQRKQIRLGNCVICGRPRGKTPSISRCRMCLDKTRKETRQRRKCKPWRPGGLGRPPLDRSE